MTSPSPSLSGCSVLVLEDLFLIACEIEKLLTDAGAIVFGPYAEAGLAIARADQQKPDCALVDIVLAETPSFVPAKALLARAVPVVFVTGLGPDQIPPELAKVPLVQKPARAADVIEAIAAACAASVGEAWNVHFCRPMRARDRARSPSPSRPSR